MKLLALDTATEACSVAVLDGDTVVERYQLAPREHNRLILPMIEQVLAETGLTAGQLDAVAFGCGPGSFTGVRMAAGVAQGLALGLDLPVAPVSTLAALSLDALVSMGCERAFACIDARMSEVYWGVYERQDDGDVQLLAPETVGSAGQVLVPPGAAGVGIGSGWASYAGTLSCRVGAALLASLPDRYPRAAAVARLAAFVIHKGGGLEPEQAQPAYLRDQVAKKPGGGAAHAPASSASQSL